MFVIHFNNIDKHNSKYLESAVANRAERSKNSEKSNCRPRDLFLAIGYSITLSHYPVASPCPFPFAVASLLPFSCPAPLLRSLDPLSLPHTIPQNIHQRHIVTHFPDQISNNKNK